MDAEGEKEATGIPSDEEIPREAQTIIKEEVERQLKEIADDPEFRETIEDIYGEVLADYAESSYLFLKWLDREFQPERVLYPASGADRIPKTALGDKVFHLSLEEFWVQSDETKGKRHFKDLEEGQRTVAEFGAIPFGDSQFQVVLFMDAAIEIVEPARAEAERVLAEDGLVVLAQNVLMGEEDKVVAEEEPEFAEEHRQVDIVEIYRKSPLFKEVSVPEKFQNEGASKTEFFIFRKTKSK
jgi:hypothetical protein